MTAACLGQTLAHTKHICKSDKAKANNRAKYAEGVQNTQVLTHRRHPTERFRASGRGKLCCSRASVQCCNHNLVDMCSARETTTISASRGSRARLRLAMGACTDPRII